jgi:uncharacterized protein (TIGR02001 family)
MRTPAAVLAILVVVTLAAPAPAQQASSPSTFTANVSLASEFISRGLSLSNRKPAIQGGLDWAHASGLYLGTWASSATILSDLGGSNSLEWDLYGGYKTSAGDFGLDAGALYFYYPGTYPDGWVSANTLELYLGGSWKVLSLKYYYGLTDQFGFKTPSGGDTTGSSYVELAGTFPVGAGVTVTALVGYQRIRGFADASYTGWKLGVSKDLAGFSLAVGWVGTNAKGAPGEPYRNVHGTDLGAGRIFASVGRVF